MPTYKVENGSTRDKAIKVHGGTQIVKAGKSATVEGADISKTQADALAAQGVKVTEAGKSKPADKLHDSEKKSKSDKPYQELKG